ncbi:MAG: HAD family hydrolase [Nitrospirota bacterium]
MNLIGLDLDGTLEDSRADMAAAVKRVRAALGLAPRSHDAIRPWVNRGMDHLYRACFDDYLNGDDSRLAVVRERYEADYGANVAHETGLYPGIADALTLLADQGRLAVITNKPERISHRLLDVLGVGKRISAIIGGDTCAASKPDPRVLSEAAARCGFVAGRGRAVMIGDSTADIRLGRAFGAATIWCAWGYADHPDEHPDFVARRPDELPDLVGTAFAS